MHWKLESILGKYIEEHCQKLHLKFKQSVPYQYLSLRLLKDWYCPSHLIMFNIFSRCMRVWELHHDWEKSFLNPWASPILHWLTLLVCFVKMNFMFPWPLALREHSAGGVPIWGLLLLCTWWPSLLRVEGEAGQVSPEETSWAARRDPAARNQEQPITRWELLCSYSSIKYRPKHYVKSQAIYQLLKYMSLLEGTVESCQLRPLLLR